MDRPLLDVVGAINSSLDVGTVLQQITGVARALLRADLARIALREHGEETMRFRHAIGASSDEIAAHRLEPGKGLVGLVLETGQPVRTDDYLEDPRISRDYAALVRREGIVAAIAVPILIDGRTEGLLYVARRGARPFTAENEALLVQVAAVAAVAIRNALSAARLRTLARLTQLVSSALDPRQVLQAIADAAGDLMDAPFVAIFTADEDRQIVERVALRSSASEPAPPPRPFRYGEGLVGLAARERRTIHVADVANDPRVVRRDYLVQERVRSVLAVPILCEEALLGVITLSRRAPFALGPEDTQTLDSFVAHAGIAIRNAQLYAESEDRRRAAEALVDVGHALTEVLDPDEVARRAVASVRRLLDAPSAALYRRTPDSADMRLLMGAHDPTAVPLDWAPVLPASGALGALSVTQRRPLWSSDVTADARFTLAPDVRARLHGAGYGAVLAVPLIAVGEAVGSIVVADRVGRTFQPRDVRLAQAFADQAAIALRNARMVDDLARTQHELAHAQKMEAVGQLAGGVAHDFNNLLTIIIGRADFVLDQVGIPPAVQRDVEIIQSAAVRAAALTRQLLAFGRKQVLRPTVLDLRDVVERMLPLLARLLPESIEVLSRHERHSAPVRGDRGQLEQVLINLAVNARDAMPSGGRLVISTAHVTLASQQPTAGGHLPPGTYAVLGVEDTGTGMAPDVQARIFEPFYTTKQIGKGTGLGLSTVYGIVSQHGGGITVDSTPGRGATFRVYLPLEESAVPAGVAAPAAPVTGGTETVLVVEDQADLRRFVREILERYGYRVLDASTPTDALALVEREGGVVDLLVTDVVMPEMSGPDTARLLRERRGRLPILYMTGYPREALETTAPAGEFLQKPFTGVDLLERVRAVLDAAGGGEAVS